MKIKLYPSPINVSTINKPMQFTKRTNKPMQWSVINYKIEKSHIKFKSKGQKKCPTLAWYPYVIPYTWQLLPSTPLNHPWWRSIPHCPKFGNDQTYQSTQYIDVIYRQKKVQIIIINFVSWNFHRPKSFVRIWAKRKIII